MTKYTFIPYMTFMLSHHGIFSLTWMWTAAEFNFQEILFVLFLFLIFFQFDSLNLWHRLFIFQTIINMVLVSDCCSSFSLVLTVCSLSIKMWSFTWTPFLSKVRNRKSLSWHCFLKDCAVGHGLLLWCSSRWGNFRWHPKCSDDHSAYSTRPDGHFTWACKAFLCGKKNTESWIVN